MVCGGATGRPVPHFAVSYAVPQLSFAVRAVRAVPSCACCALVARQLGVVDTFGSSSVSTFISPGNLRIMVMYDGAKSEDALKHFFTDVHALYLKVEPVMPVLPRCRCARSLSLSLSLSLAICFAPHPRV
jgi:hypothetical protein